MLRSTENEPLGACVVAWPLGGHGAVVLDPPAPDLAVPVAVDLALDLDAAVVGSWPSSSSPCCRVQAAGAMTRSSPAVAGGGAERRSRAAAASAVAARVRVRVRVVFMVVPPWSMSVGCPGRILARAPVAGRHWPVVLRPERPSRGPAATAASSPTQRCRRTRVARPRSTGTWLGTTRTTAQPAATALRAPVLESSMARQWLGMRRRDRARPSGTAPGAACPCETASPVTTVREGAGGQARRGSGSTKRR